MPPTRPITPRTARTHARPLRVASSVLLAVRQAAVACTLFGGGDAAADPPISRSALTPDLGGEVSARFPGSAGESVTRSVEERATRDDFSLDTNGTSSVIKMGGEGQFRLVVTPKNGKRVHPDAPFEVVFKAPRGVRPAKMRLGRADIVNKAGTAPEVRTTLHPEQAGSAALEASVSFFLCTDSWCQRMTDRLTVDITVEK